MADTTPKTRGYGKELGQSGTLIYQGFIRAEDYNVNLTGKRAIAIYERMRRSDPTVRSTLKVVKLPAQTVQKKIEPASEDAFDIEVAKHVENELFHRNINFAHFQHEAFTFVDFGYSIFEPVYEITDFEGKPRIGLKKLAFRKQKSLYAWQTKEGTDGITQQLDTTTVSIPRDKLIIFTNDMEGDNYEGISILRYAYKAWDLKEKLEMVNAISLEKLGSGIPVIRKPAAPDATDESNARDTVRNIRANEEAFIEMPDGWDVEMLDMKGATTKDLLPTIQHYERQIKLSVLAQFLDLGASGAAGSRSTSEDHSKLFMLSEEALVTNFDATVQEQLIKRLCDLNYTELPNGYPKLVSSRVNDDDVTALSEAVSKLTAAKHITPNFDTEQHFRKVAHLPELPEEDRAKYEKRQEALDELALQPKTPVVAPAPDKKSAPATKTADKTITEEKKVKASAIEDALNFSRQTHERIIKVMYED